MELTTRTIVIAIILIILFAIALLIGLDVKSHFITQVNNTTNLTGGILP